MSLSRPAAPILKGTRPALVDVQGFETDCERCGAEFELCRPCYRGTKYCKSYQKPARVEDELPTAPRPTRAAERASPR